MSDTAAGRLRCLGLAFTIFKALLISNDRQCDDFNFNFQLDGKGSMGGVTLGVVVAAGLGAVLAAIGIAFAVLCARRRRSPPPHKHPPGDMLELSDGGRRYVVAYTIKPSPDSKTPDPQPDILNAQGAY